MKRNLLLAAVVFASSCVTAPPLLAPTPPRRSLEARYARMRVRVGAFHDRTTLLGVVSDYDTGPFFRSGPTLISAPGSNVTTTTSQVLNFFYVRATSCRRIFHTELYFIRKQVKFCNLCS
jgi:hypothetical protein